MTPLNPATVIAPASAYAQGVRHALGGERLVVSGQLGLAPDGRLEAGMEAQMQRAWANVIAILAAGGFEVRHMVKATVYVTDAGHTALYRRVRDQALGGHMCAMTYLQIAGLAAPEFLVEIEAEAIKE